MANPQKHSKKKINTEEFIKKYHIIREQTRGQVRSQTGEHSFATFDLKNRKYFHTDKIASFLHSSSVQEIISEKKPFVSFRIFLINRKSEILLERSPITSPYSWWGLIPFSTSFSYEYVEKYLLKLISHLFPTLKVKIGQFIDLKYHESSISKEMIYFYAILIESASDVPCHQTKQIPVQVLSTDFEFSFKSLKTIDLKKKNLLIPFQSEIYLIDLLYSKLQSLSNQTKTNKVEIHPMIKENVKQKFKPNFETIGAIVGRFQPFHLGHAKLIQTMLNNHHYIKIGVGSSQYAGTPDNPFSFEQRKKMIELTLKAKKISNARYSIYAIPDLHDYEKWGSSVIEILSPFDFFYSNSPWTRQIMKEYQKKCAPLLKFDFESFNGNNIRNRLRKQKSIEDLVPIPVNDYLKSLNLEKILP